MEDEEIDDNDVDPQMNPNQKGGGKPTPEMIGIIIE